MTFLRLVTLSLVLVAVFGCTLPQASTRHKDGTLVIRLSNPGRTIGADWNTLIQSYQATLKSQNGHLDVVGSVSGAATLTLTGIRDGTWDLEVKALDSTAQVVAQAKVLNITIPAASPVAVTLAPTRLTTGSYNFALRFPTFAGASLITKVTGQRTKPDLTPVGPGFNLVPTDLGGGLSQAAFSEIGVASGSYRLALTLFRGAPGSEVPVKYVLEAVNVWDNVDSNKWIDGSGAAQAVRALAAPEFASTNTDLAGLEVSVDGSLEAFDRTFVGTDKADYTLTVTSDLLTQPLLPRATASAPNQVLDWSTDAGITWVPLASGVDGPSFDLIQGDNSLLFRVSVVRNGTTLATSQYQVIVTKLVSVNAVVADTPTLTIPTGSTDLVLAHVEPIEADNQNLLYTSSDDTLATVDLDGTVHALLPGTVTITSESEDGGFTDVTLVTLTPTQFLLRSNAGAYWTDWSGSSLAPWGTVAIAGNENTLVALTDVGDLWTFDHGVWVKSELTPPTGTQWLCIDGDGRIWAASSSQVFSNDGGLWYANLPLPPVPLQGFAIDRLGVHAWGTDDQLWDLDTGVWRVNPVALPALATGLASGDGSMGAFANDHFVNLKDGRWRKSSILAEPQTVSSTLAFGNLVSLIVR